MCNTTKICKFCNQPVETIVHTSLLSGVSYPMHTCKNKSCRAGKLEITLCDESFDALDEAILETYERGTSGTVRQVPTRQAVQS